MPAALLALILGIWYGYSHPDITYWPYAIATALVACLCVGWSLYAQRFARSASIFTAVPVFFFGAMLSVHTIAKQTIDFPTHQALYQAKVTGTVERRKASWLIPAELQCYFDSAAHRHHFDTPASVYLYLQRDSAEQTPPQGLQEGQIVLIGSTMRSTSPLLRPDTLDESLRLWQERLFRRGIVASGYVRQSDIHPTPLHATKSLKQLAQHCQQIVLQQFERWGIEQPELGVLASLTIGYREILDNEVRADFTTAGAMHVLAVSGLHVGIIAGIALWLLTLGGHKPLYEERKKRWILFITTTLIVWAYAFLTGLTPSVTRAALMLCISSFVILIGRPISLPRVLILSAFVLLLFRPLDLFSISFQLSYAAVLGIAVLTRNIERLFFWWLPDRLRSAFAASMAAVVATLPVTVLNFHQLPVYGILLSPLVILLTMIVIGTTLAAFPISLFSTVVAHRIVYYPLHVLLIVTGAVDHWPMAIIPLQADYLSMALFVLVLVFWAGKHSTRVF